MRGAWAFAAVVVLSMSACAKAAETSRPEAQKPQQTSPEVSQASQGTGNTEGLADFNARLGEYVKLHERLEATLPPLPKETDPTVIDKHQRSLQDLIRAERKGARRGDIITPGAERVIRRVLTQVFGGPDGKQLKASIMDENPGGEVKLAVNARYPDEIPLSTVPPQVLKSLPKLPPDVEYRFIGDRLILLDVHAHMIVDYIDNALPA